MSLRIHTDNPADLVETAYFRVLNERMADVPILNAALGVEAVDFQRWRGHWLGVVVTPWCMSALLVPGKTEDWESVGDNKRRFVGFPAGDMSFLGSEEDEIGEFQSCSLISPMGQFATQAEAVQTARAALIAMLQAPIRAEPVADKPAPDPPSKERRRFLFLR